MAENGDGRRGGLVVLRSEQPATKSFHSQRREIITCDIFRAKRLGVENVALAADAKAARAGLKGGQFFKLRRGSFEAFIEREREHAPAVLRATFHAAIVTIADTIEERRIGDGQRPQHHRMNEGEDSSGAPGTQRQRENRGGGKNRGKPELSQGVTKSPHDG